jgi:SAM-dependent methyltransferase
VIALDYSDEMLDRVRDAVRRHGWTNVAPVQGDAARLPLDEGSIDAALCTLALSTMPDPRAVIRAVHRCLKPGGRLAVVDAKLFDGRWQIFNPVALAVFVPTTNWNVAVDLVATMRDVFGNVGGARLNRGSTFLAVSRKDAGPAESSAWARGRPSRSARTASPGLFGAPASGYREQRWNA